MTEKSKQSFVLTISPKYVPDWGKWEAFREIMQNSIDRKNEYAQAEIIFSYLPDQRRIIIGNRLSILERKTLILGEGNKADNEDAIGKYGEGYKLALLVFIRLGVRVRIRTGAEVWAPEIRHSELYDTDLLTIDVIKATPSDNLIFELDNISAEDYQLFRNRCLFLNPPVNKIETSMGDILLDENLKKKVFVEGLFVCEFSDQEKIRYGYSMKAPYIALDRDRKKVDSFNLWWQIARMYAGLDGTYAQMVYSLRRENWLDIQYYDNHSKGKGNRLYDELCTMHHTAFLEKFGKAAIPCKDKEEADYILQRYNGLIPVVVPVIEYKYITEAAGYSTGSKAKVVRESTPYSITKDSINKILAGKEFKEAREKMIKEFLPKTMEWKKR